jgi:hypothetical protein
VIELNISPTEAWRLNFREISAITGIHDKNSQDLSLMVNWERKANGCPKFLIEREEYCDGLTYGN